MWGVGWVHTLTYESPSAAAALSAFLDDSYCAATLKTPVASSRFQNMMSVRMFARAFGPCAREHSVADLCTSVRGSSLQLRVDGLGSPKKRTSRAGGEGLVDLLVGDRLRERLVAAGPPIRACRGGAV